MIELIFQKELILIEQINKKNVCFVIIGFFLDKNFTYGTCLCDGCYNIMQKSTDIAIVYVRKTAYRIYFMYLSKREAKNLMNNSNLIDKKGVL